MKLHIVARGKIGQGPEADLVARYAERLGKDFAITELPERGGRMKEPPSPHRVVALDEKGRDLSSRKLAAQLEHWRDEGVREVRFLIGAADGLTGEERQSADMLLAFGKATWPHLLVRAMLAEQLYRAMSILANHPYHRD